MNYFLVVGMFPLVTIWYVIFFKYYVDVFEPSLCPCSDEAAASHRDSLASSPTRCILVYMVDAAAMGWVFTSSTPFFCPVIVMPVLQICHLLRSLIVRTSGPFSRIDSLSDIGKRQERRVFSLGPPPQQASEG